MGIWDSVKEGAGNFAQLTTLQNKVKNNQPLTPEENEAFEKLSKSTVLDEIERHPSKYFSGSVRYGLLQIDEVKRLFKINSDVYRFDELNSYELLENGSTITSGGLGVGRAIVGGALLGGVGAILGGVTKKKKSTNIVESLKILVTFKNRKPVSTTIDFIKKKQQRDKKFEKVFEQAKETLSGFDLIVGILEGDKHQELTEASSSTQNDSTADELRKYKSLADEGIITPEEFEEKKRQLLGL